MRYDFNVLWIEDSSAWLETAKEGLDIIIEDFGYLTNYKIIESNMNELKMAIEKESSGFKLYDLIFVDYNISGEDIHGDDVIECLRKADIDADILFYSDKFAKIEDQKKTVADYGFDGIYVTTKENFNGMAVKLYKKNIHNLNSILNIRGLLTDKTSENDFIMNSYLRQNIKKLTPENKQILDREIKSILQNQINEAKEGIEKGNKILSDKTSIATSKLFDLPSFIFSISNKYKIFSKMLELTNSAVFDNNHSIENYINKIIKIRNTLAHKKIDICKQQKFLMYYDTLTQYENRKCPDNCDRHSDDKKISVIEWSNLLKQANEYSKNFDLFLNEMIEENKNNNN